MKNLILMAILWSLSLPIQGNTELPEALKTQFYQAYLNRSIQLWEDGVQQLEQRYKADPQEAHLFQLAASEYGMVSICMANKNDDKAQAYLAKAEKHIKKYLKKQDSGEAHAILAGIYGLRISFSPMKGMWLGPRSNSELGKAMKIDNTNPRVWYQHGSSFLFTPATWGGDIEQSVTHFQKAVELHETKACLDNDWEYLDALAWLGQAQVKNGEPAKAIATYQKALEVEPNFSWVRNYLLPSVQKG